MENKEHSQLELFQQIGASGQNRPSGRSFIFYMRRYEKRILLLMVFLVTGIVSFSLGVENGKAIALRKINTHLDMAQRMPAQKAVVQAPSAPAQEKLNPPIVKPVRPESLTNYIIQLASFKTRASAEKEAQALKKRGLPAMIKQKGNFIVLYAGSFPSQVTASAALTQLKKQYRDCILRRL